MFDIKFNINAEPAKLRDEYGRNAAGQRMLMARRLVASGVRFVSLTYGGWDMHTTIKAGMVNEDTLKGSDVHVDAKNHVVTLSGTVTSEAGRARAVEIAKTTKGVDRVIDKTTIGPKK